MDHYQLKDKKNGRIFSVANPYKFGHRMYSYIYNQSKYIYLTTHRIPYSIFELEIGGNLDQRTFTPLEQAFFPKYLPSGATVGKM